MHKKILILLVVLICLLIASAAWLAVETEKTEQAIEEIEIEIELLEAENNYLRGRVAELKELQAQLEGREQAAAWGRKK